MKKKYMEVIPVRKPPINAHIPAVFSTLSQVDIGIIIPVAIPDCSLKSPII